MSYRNTCVQCGAESVTEDNVWKPGQWLLFNMLFCCSRECGVKYAAENAAEGYRPGEPNFELFEPATEAPDLVTNTGENLLRAKPSGADRSSSDG